ncbi:type II secretion system secretin GspD [Bradyrhizobium brasilense]|uniref:Type II secretion system secretin GspD n=1 Tax=Bradyrhizobium brasilense TaxID=1419277 RepID=A0ABY8JLZ4_9BRAD|nr:type II secretion system secretin GspD [Bradyrhizobium brasilense]WFU66682.1 type II secretion system secretin GspD [Bradyrhizobium brasilense]
MVGGNPAPLPLDQGEQDPVTLNLVNAPIDVAAKSVLGDTLKLNYSIDPAVSGKVTIQTSTPISRPELIKLFQHALAANGATIVRNGSSFRLVTVEQARNGPVRVQVEARQGEAAEAAGEQIGASMRVVPLKYVAASQMQRILEPMVGKSSIVSVDDERNTITLAGDSQEIASILNTVSIFDVDMMKGKSVQGVAVRAPPEAIVADLKAIFGTDKGGMKGMVQFLPNERLKSILVVSAQRDYLAKAEMWIKRLDARAQGNDRQLFTYKVQNRSAKELVAIINEMFSSSRTDTASRNVAPRYQQADLQSAEASQPAAGQGISLGQGTAPGPAAEGAPASSPAGMGSGDGERVRVTADEGKNALLILATGSDYRRVVNIIRNLDVAPKQVLIEATIAEVSLNDNLKFGVRWYFQGKRASYQFTDAAAKVFGSVFPGFSYAWQAANVQATLDALNQITSVNIVSAPSLMAVENKPATLQIGDQVPIVTQSATGVLAAGAPVVNSVSYRDTGVILSITPRINDGGRVLLDIQQEVSSVSSTTSSNIDSPTIKQRKVRTTVMVNDNEAVVLGGIIQAEANTDHTQVPIVGDIPLLGNAFKSKSDTAAKTELLVLITPHVVYDPSEARAITDEYRARLNIALPSRRSVSHSLGRTLEKVLE